MNALVTGGTRGIGRAVSLQLAREGYRKIFANYLQNDPEAERTAKTINDLGAECILVKANLADLDQIDNIFIQILTENLPIHAIVHCAALNSFKPLSQIKPNQWDLTMNINSRSFLYLVQQCLTRIPAGGSIVALSSLGSRKVVSNYGALGPAKAAMESIVRYLAVELADKGINVNAVCGGIINTTSIEKFPNYQSWLDNMIKKTPSGRIGQPKDIANAVAFLCRKESRFITGQILIVDGGLSLL